MFDLDAFDREVSHRFPAETVAEASLRSAYTNFTRHKAKLGMAACVAISTATAAWALSPVDPVPTLPADMTYNGMTLTDFADEMGLSATDPHVIFIFQDLCAQEEAEMAYSAQTS